MPLTAAEAREALARAGITQRDVAVPGDRTSGLRMGSLRLVPHDAGVDIVAWDYGTERVLLRCRDIDEAVRSVVSRWQISPERARRVSSADFASWAEETRQRVASLAGLLDTGATVETTLVPGSVVDRFGNLDGFLLYPGGEPLAARSLPPDVIDPTRRQHGLVVLGVAQPVAVLAARIAPAFGQPGGGTMFGLAEPSDTVRDLLARGELELLSVGDE